MRENSFYSDWYVTGSPKSSFSRWAAGGKDGERETSVPTLPGFCTYLTLVFSCYFDDSPSDRSGVISHCGFDFHFADD